MGIFLYFENNKLSVSYYSIKNNKIPATFKNYKIIHLSDLHSKEFGQNNKQMLRILEKENPDLIVITGDLIDRRRYDEDKSLTIVRGMQEISPICFVTGNHEGVSRKFNSLERELKCEGVIVLRNEKRTITRENDKLIILGIDDPSFKSFQATQNKDVIETELSKLLCRESKEFKILLSHRPEHFELYSNFGIDLSLTGHAHGGQIGFPFIGALVVPHQDFPPKYYKGLYRIDESEMIVSRGLGNSIFPQRLFNRPEIVIITLDIVND